MKYFYKGQTYKSQEEVANAIFNSEPIKKIVKYYITTIFSYSNAELEEAFVFLSHFVPRESLKNLFYPHFIARPIAGFNDSLLAKTFNITASFDEDCILCGSKVFSGFNEVADYLLEARKNDVGEWYFQDTNTTAAGLFRLLNLAGGEKALNTSMRHFLAEKLKTDDNLRKKFNVKVIVGDV